MQNDQNPSERAQAHATAAEQFVAEAHELLSKRGRRLGQQEQATLALADVHATLALFYQREATS